jgi:F-type H+-transporting ATPase subunit b
MPRKLILILGLLGLTVLFAPAVARESVSEVESRVNAAGHGGEVAPEPKILELKPELAITTLIVFVVLLFVLQRFAWGPLAKALSDREHNMESAVTASEHAKAEAERLLAQHRAQMDQAGEQVRAILDEARRDAAALADTISKKAQAEADAARERAERDIATARDHALLDIYAKSADLAVSVAGKVLGRELNESDHRRLVEYATAELPATAGKGSA